MKVVVDRLVQYANRYKLTDVNTGAVLGTFDFVEETGTVQQVGTEINAELFDSIADDLAQRVVTNGGNASALVVNFPDTTTVENITTGETIKTTFSKIANWFKSRISKLKKYTYDSSTLIAKSDIADGVIPPVVQATGTSTSNVMSQSATTSAVNTALSTAKTYAETTVQDAITQQTGSGTDVVMSQNAVTTELNKKVDKVSGKQLSTNDYTTAEKNKLAGITEGANKYVLPIATASVLGGIKSGNDISISTSGLVTVLDNSHNHTIANVTGLQASLDAKYVKPSTGIPLTDLASAVQTSLGKADTALQSLPATVVHTNTVQTITGAKTFTGAHAFTGETKFTNSQYVPTFTDIGNGLGKSSCFTRGALMQTITGQIIASNTAVDDAARGYNTEKNKIKFQYIISTADGQPTLGELAVLSTTGMTIGTKTVATVDQIPTKYAGSTTAGGSATSSVKLDTSAGSATQPVYFSGGKPVATTYTLGASVPSGAKFTDTTYSVATQSANGLLSASDKKKLDTNVVTLDGTQTITGVKTFNAPTNVASTEQVTTWFNTANGGRIGFGKEKDNSGTGIFFDQVSGTRRLNFRASATAGAMVWEQPEKGAQLYVDLGAKDNDYHRVSFPSSSGTLALTSQLTADTGATSVAVSGSGNAVTTASYDASTRKLTLTKGTTFLTSHQNISGKLSLSGGTMTGNLKWSSNTALPEITSPKYLVAIDAFAEGGTTKWTSIANVKTALGVVSTTATTSANGLMSASDKSKLDGITASADSVSFTRSLTSGTKIGTITINGTSTNLYAPTSQSITNYVTTDTAQTITGAKTFNNTVVVDGGNSLKVKEADGSAGARYVKINPTNFIYSNNGTTEYTLYFPQQNSTLATLSDITQYYLHDISLGYFGGYSHSFHFSFICTKSSGCTWQEVYQYAPKYNIAVGLITIAGTKYPITYLQFNTAYNVFSVGYLSSLNALSTYQYTSVTPTFSDTVKRIA